MASQDRSRTRPEAPKTTVSSADTPAPHEYQLTVQSPSEIYSKNVEGQFRGRTAKYGQTAQASRSTNHPSICFILIAQV
jgi:hypothetical protein